MEDQTGKRSAAAEEEGTPLDRGLMPQLLVLSRAFMAAPERTKRLLLGAGLVAVIGATAFSQLRLNAWHRPFYDALARKDLGAFTDQLLVFAVIASVLLCLNVAQIWLNQMTKVKLREGLARDLFHVWLQPRRAFRLAGAGDIGVNPDQRIHEDTRHLTELTTDLGIGLLQSSLLLGSFLSVLWSLSAAVTFYVHGHRFMIPGYMVWCALVYAGAASWLSWRVGRPLIRLHAERYAREADLRFALVRVNEHIDAVALAGGEAVEQQRVQIELDHVVEVLRRIVTATTRLTWVTAGYGWFTIIAPILVAAPGFFGGDLSFGELMMAVAAFIQVQQALRWFVDNFPAIADWRATLLRVALFRQAVVTMDGLGSAASQIEFVHSSESTLRFDHLEIATPTGCTMLSERHVAIMPGERVLIVGEPGAGKTILFRAIAGLWPWGAGRITMPSEDRVIFVPREPYVPPGTLRAVLAYPFSETAYADDELIAALKRTGLEHLSSSLDRSARWDRELSYEEQHSLVFARLPLHKPRWVVIDEALDALEEDTWQRITVLFTDALAEAAVLNIGRPAPRSQFWTRVLHLIKDTQGRQFKPHRHLATAEQAQPAPAPQPVHTAE